MVTPVQAIKSLKRWQMVVLIVVLVGAGGSAYTVYGRTNGPGLEGLAEKPCRPRTTILEQQYPIRWRYVNSRAFSR